MLRSAIVYRTASYHAEPHEPVAVLVEDAAGVWIEPLPGEEGFAGWCTRGRVREDHSMHHGRSIPRPGSPGPGTLEYVARTSLSDAMLGRTLVGKITAHPDASGSADALARTLARTLAAARAAGR